MTQVPLKPLGREDIRKLELALILGSMFRKDVLEQALSSTDKVTWLDSLIVAAGALARERAGYTIPRIAEELGRTEATIRNHLQGKTEAGKIVKETYEELVKNGGELKLELPVESREDCRELQERLGKARELAQKLLEALSAPG